MRNIEKQLENRCVAWARAHGWDCWKNENNGNTGIPDHSLLKGGRFIMVEFKASATARIRPEQLTWKQRHPDVVFFCHDFDTFTQIIEPKRNGIVCGDCLHITEDCAGFHEITDKPCTRFKLNIQR